MSSEMTQIDSTVEVVTPENIAFHYQVAGPFRRLPAFLLDVLIRAAVFALCAIAIVFVGGMLGLPGMGFAVVAILWFLSDWFYGGICETLMNGQTFGKRTMGIRVLTVDGQPINGVQAVMRNFLRSVDMMPMLSMEVLGISAPAYIVPTFILALVTMTMNRRFQRLGDIVSGTIVVVEERQWLTGVAKLEDPRAAQLANYIPANFVVSRSMARSLAGYVDRRRFFSIARRREVARHVAEPLIERFGFPADTSYDLLLCALYYRAFVADRSDEEVLDDSSPFGPTSPPEVKIQPFKSSLPIKPKD
jgi:uncharacterized RDD family membrane protein YckC